MALAIEKFFQKLRITLHWILLKLRYRLSLRSKWVRKIKPNVRNLITSACFNSFLFLGIAVGMRLSERFGTYKSFLETQCDHDGLLVPAFTDKLTLDPKNQS